MTARTTPPFRADHVGSLLRPSALLRARRVLPGIRRRPPGKQVVLGLVTTKRGALESKDELKRRIDEASRYIPLNQLCRSPQCGFSSTVEGNVLTYDEQVAKLRLVVETAAEVWG
jgi:5-methyltetrahydropteroyltriglutamate--homocysteine methyltransferase